MGSKTSAMLRKERLTKSNVWKTKPDKLRAALVACIAVVGRDDCSGPSDLKLYQSIQIFGFSVAGMPRGQILM